MRHVTRIKKPETISDKELTVIILNATIGKVISKPRSNISFNDGETLLTKQVQTIRKIAPRSELIVVTGEKCDEVYSAHKKLEIKYVENERYYETNTMRSLAVGLLATVNKNVLVMHGDLLFDQDSLVSILQNESMALVGKQLLDHKVGIISDNGLISNISFGLPQKWAQIVLFTNRELESLRVLAADNNKWNWYIWEAIHNIVHKNGEFKVHDGNITEINTQKDIDKVNKCLK
jgi:choline kinase